MSQWSKTNQVFMKSNFLSDLRKKEKVLYFSLRDIFVLESPDHIARDIVSSSPSSELD